MLRDQQFLAPAGARSPAAYVPRDRRLSIQGRTARRMGGARDRAARPQSRSLSIGLLLDVCQHWRLALQRVLYVIALAIRWYVRYRLSYADVMEWFAERGLVVDRSTVYRWVQRFLPLFGEAARAHRTGHELP